MNRSAHRTLIAALSLCATLLTACGSGDSTPEPVAVEAKADPALKRMASSTEGDRANPVGWSTDTSSEAAQAGAGAWWTVAQVLADSRLADTPAAVLVEAAQAANSPLRLRLLADGRVQGEGPAGTSLYTPAALWDADAAALRQDGPALSAAVTEVSPGSSQTLALADERTLAGLWLLPQAGTAAAPATALPFAQAGRSVTAVWPVGSAALPAGAYQLIAVDSQGRRSVALTVYSAAP